MPQTEDLGIAHTQYIVAEMGYFFRLQPTHDFGIDAQVETSDETGRGSGRILAVQIKSGTSYFRVNSDGDIVHYTDQRHISYWAEHTLPVILIIYNPEQHIAWWCDVKAYLSRNPNVLTKPPYAIHISQANVFTSNLKDTFASIADTRSYPLELQNEDYNFISVNDISFAGSKRYRAEVLVGNFVNRDTVRLTIFQATERLKTTIEHSSPKLEAFWQNQSPHIIRLFVYRDLLDKAHSNWIAQSIWRDSSHAAAKQMYFGRANDYTHDIEIEFADDSKHQSWRRFLSSKTITKTEFFKKVQNCIPTVDSLVERAEKLYLQLNNAEISQYEFDGEMTLLAQHFSSLEQQIDQNTIAPIDCRDAEQRFNRIIAASGNIFLPFTPHGLKTWIEAIRRNVMLHDYLKRFTVEREMLAFEMRKLAGK